MRNLELFPNSKTDFKNPAPITLDEGDQTLWINTVFGVNIEGQLPARFLSGFVSSFGLAQTIVEKTKGRATPTVRIFIPEHISQLVNGISSQSTERQITQGTEMLQEMVKNHFPSIEIFIERDNPPSEDVVEVLGQLATVIAQNCDEGTVRRIRDSGFKRGKELGEGNALLYAAHHGFGWSDLHHAAVFEQEPPFTVINTLPPSEKPYTAIRKEIVSQIAESEHRGMVCEGKRFDLVVMMCDRPHYLLIEDAQGTILEPTLDDLNSTPCGEILEFLKRRHEEEQTPWTRDFLRRAKIDFEKLLDRLSHGKTNDALSAQFSDLLKGDV